MIPSKIEYSSIDRSGRRIRFNSKQILENFISKEDLEEVLAGKQYGTKVVMHVHESRENV